MRSIGWRGVGLAIITCMLGAPGACAADFLVDQQRGTMAPRAIADWSGLYAGLHGGWLAGGEQAQDPDGAVASTEIIDLAGVSTGVLLGANWQSGPLVFGAEVSFATSGFDGSDACPNPAFTCGAAVDWVASTRGRIGLAWRRVLLFAAAGPAVAEIEAETSPKVAGASGSFESTAFGWTAGGGAELSIRQNLSIKTEYVYYGFAERTAASGTLSAFRDVDVGADLHTVRLGVNIHF